METRTWSLKIIIIGQPSVGKTSLRRAYLGDKFRISYISTIGADFSFKAISLGNDQINTSIWDLAGQETFQNVHPQYYRGSAGALVVYDVTKEETFNKVEEWIDKYQALTGEHKCPILVVGNKIDLMEEGHPGISEERQEELIKLLLKKHGNRFPILSARTSAKTGRDINECFALLVKEIIDWQRNRVQATTTSTELQVDDYLPASYVLTFHDTEGPRIIVRDPIVDRRYSDQEFASTIKITSTLDFGDVVENAQVTGSTPWTYPKGTFYYIAFAIQNPSARGGQSLFIIGFIANRDLREIIAQSQHIVDGHLHAVLNEFVRIVQERQLDLTSEESGELQPETKKAITNLLSKIRQDIFNTIKSSLL